MAQARYAKDQAPGFTNRIERIAIAGATGTLGKHIVQALLSTGNQHTITALTRGVSSSSSGTSTLTAGVTPVTVDYTSEASVTSALRGQQFLIICLSVTAPPDTGERLIRAAAAAGVGYVMPNAFGHDVRNEALCRDTWHAASALRDVAQLEGVGVGWVAMVCGLWYEYSLAMGPEWFGFDFHAGEKAGEKKRKVTFFDDGRTRINVTTWEQCGRAVAGLLGLKELPEDEGDKSPTVSGWRNRPLYVSSFLVSQRDIFESWKRVSGETDEDWEVAYEGSVERYQRGVREMEGGSMVGRAVAMFARVWYANGDGNYEERCGLDNDVLGLPKEDLDECTRKAKAMIEGGYAAMRMKEMGF